MTASSGCGPAAEKAAWTLPNADLASTRALLGTGIDANSVRSLAPAWRFRIPTSAPDASGAVTATPVVAGDVVFIQDMRSNVYAVGLEDGRLRWTRRFDVASPGPNGLAVDDRRVYGVTDQAAFALDVKTGRPLWTLDLINEVEHYVDVAPQVDGDHVFVSTVGYRPNGKGALHALDARTGAPRWRFSTIREPWRHPLHTGGGGAWYPPSVDAGSVYWGTANPTPWGGTPAFPNGAAFAGRALYTDSLLVLDAITGRLRWYDQVTPHDIRDYDFQLSPILGRAGDVDAVFGAGKSGHVIAWSRSGHTRLWESSVGLHRNDRGPLPRTKVEVCPGLLGGVETPMAYDGVRLYVPVVNLCARGSAVGYSPLATLDVSGGTGELVALEAASGRVAWRRRLAEATFGCATVADGVVFTSTVDGVVYGLDATTGAELWRSSLRAGVNACPALAPGRLIVAAGVGANRPGEVVAFATATRRRR